MSSKFSSKIESDIINERNFVAAILDTIDALVVVLNRQGKIVRFNRACERATAYTAAEVLDKSFTELFLLPEEIEAVNQVVNELISGRYPNHYDNYWVTKHGEKRLISWSNTVLLEANGEVEYIVATGVDITKRKQAELTLEQTNAALHESEERYSRLFHNRHSPMLLIEPGSAMIVDANPAASDFYGWSHEELVQMKITDINQLSPDETQLMMGQAKFSAEGKAFIFNHRLKSGEIRVVEVHSGPISLKNNQYLFSIIHDITKRKQAEDAIKDYTEKLKQANRELQDFSYIASHDLQEPLRKIQLFGERLKNQYQDQLGKEGADYIHRMTNAAQRMDLMLRGLLEYTRITQYGQPRVLVDLNQILQEVLSDLDYRVEQSGAEVLVGPLPQVNADPTQMGQLFQNLIGNALKFFAPDRHPRIQVFSSEQAAENGGKQWIEIRVEDNGIGFNEQYLDRIFQPFQRLHGRTEYDGNGMGLAICRKIVERHGGSITAKSTPGQGAAFIIRLPK